MTKWSNNYSIDLKLRVINTYNQKIYKINDIVKIFCVSKSSVYNWVKLYKSEELTSKITYIKPKSNFHNIQIRNIISEYVKINTNFIYSILISYI